MPTSARAKAQKRASAEIGEALGQARSDIIDDLERLLCVVNDQTEEAKKAAERATKAAKVAKAQHAFVDDGHADIHKTVMAAAQTARRAEERVAITAAAVERMIEARPQTMGQKVLREGKRILRVSVEAGIGLGTVYGLYRLGRWVFLRF